MHRKVQLFIATSLDGFIAGPDGDMSFLSLVQKEGEDYGYADFIRDVDTVITGRKTYDWVMTQVPEFPHADKETYIITRTEKPSTGKTIFYSGNLKELVTDLKNRTGKNIFVDGGAEIVNQLLKDNLIDEIYISILPVILGGGVRLFHEGNPNFHLKLTETKQFDTGLVQLHYCISEI